MENLPVSLETMKTTGDNLSLSPDQFKRMQALANIDRAIISTLDIDVITDIVFDQITLQLGAEICILFLQDPITSQFVCKRTKGLPGLNGNMGMTFNPPFVFAQKAIISGGMLFIDDLSLARSEKEIDLPFPYKYIHFYSAIPLVNSSKTIGVLEVCSTKSILPDWEWKNFFGMVARQATIAIEHLSLIENIQHLNKEILYAYESTLKGWAKALEYKDRETKGHSERVTEMAILLGKALDLNEEELLQLRRGAILHDIGKMCIPEKILFKTEPLTEEEWEIMKQHPIFAQEFLADIQFIQPALNIPLFHHERWDGSGYPYGLKGKQIPLSVRIFMVVDVWDALTSLRPYREAWSNLEARIYFKQNSGIQFDPDVVTKFLELLATLDHDPLQTHEMNRSNSN
jgi:HD-GYP domain-containing protein (c-di-GMP phosphodiesterase class II)